MRIQIIVCLLAVFLPVFQGKPGHMVHDYYKCASDYYRQNFKHCKENEIYNSRQGRGLDAQYSSAPASVYSSTNCILLGIGTVLLNINRF